MFYLLSTWSPHLTIFISPSIFIPSLPLSFIFLLQTFPPTVPPPRLHLIHQSIHPSLLIGAQPTEGARGESASGGLFVSLTILPYLSLTLSLSLFPPPSLSFIWPHLSYPLPPSIHNSSWWGPAPQRRRFPPHLLPLHYQPFLLPSLTSPLLISTSAILLLYLSLHHSPPTHFLLLLPLPLQPPPASLPSFSSPYPVLLLFFLSHLSFPIPLIFPLHALSPFSFSFSSFPSFHISTCLTSIFSHLPSCSHFILVSFHRCLYLFLIFILWSINMRRERVSFLSYSISPFPALLCLILSHLVPFFSSFLLLCFICPLSSLPPCFLLPLHLSVTPSSMILSFSLRSLSSTLHDSLHRLSFHFVHVTLCFLQSHPSPSFLLFLPPFISLLLPFRLLFSPLCTSPEDMMNAEVIE